MTGWAVDALIASALLMAAVLLLRTPVRRTFGPTVAYALWALPALRLVLPSLPEGWRASTATPISQATELMVYAVGPVAGESLAAPEAGAQWAAVGALLWLVGAGAFLIFHVAQYALFRARLLRRHQPVDRVGAVRVVLSPAAPGPLAFGVVSRYVALPADLDSRYDADEQSLALAHELGHHARGDLLANWVALSVLALHWWNPLAWIAHRAFRADQELANDARVLRERGPNAAHAYACAILKTAHGGAIAAACHLHTIDDLKGRLRMLKSRPASPRRLFAGAATVTLLATTGLALTASGTSAAAAVKASVGETIGVDLDAVSAVELADVLPAPPAPPVAAAPAAPLTPAAPLPPPATPPAPARAVPAPPPPLAPPASLPAPAPLAPVSPILPLPPVMQGDQHVIVIKDKDGRVTRQVIHRRDGKGAPRVYGFADGRHFDPSRLPEVRERRCGGGDHPVVENRRDGGKRVTIICTDRIERMAERQARLAERHAQLAANSVEVRRHALEGALHGLVGARESIGSNPQLRSDQRREALDEIDRSIAEMKRDLARDD